jgi:hypothetical protein
MPTLLQFMEMSQEKGLFRHLKPRYTEETSGKNRSNGRQDAYPTSVYGDVSGKRTFYRISLSAEVQEFAPPYCGKRRECSISRFFRGIRGYVSVPHIIEKPDIR